MFELVNPVIRGNKFNTSFDVKNKDEAAMLLWKQMGDSNILANHLPNFYFSLLDTSNNKLHNYNVKEGKDGKFVITSVNDSGAKETELFMNKYEEVVKKYDTDKTKGGKRRHKKFLRDSSSSSSSLSSISDSDSDSDSDFYKYMKQKKSPIKYVWYAPFIYNDDTIFTPVFNVKISPFFSLYVPVTF
jgi:hypothetical protein